MKKSTRILAILMAFVMLMGTFSVMGSAYQAYKGTAIANSYDDVDKPVFTLEQYASMGLDEVDRMLAKEQIVLNIYIGTLDLSSVSGTIASLESLLNSVQSLLPLLGDAGTITIEAIRGKRRNTNTDIEIIQSVLNLLGEIAPIAEKYVNGSISLGILTSLVGDYIFDVRELAVGLLYQLLTSGYVNIERLKNDGMETYTEVYNYFDDKKDGTLDSTVQAYVDSNSGIFSILQELLNVYVLGEWIKLDDEFDSKWSYVRYESYEFATKYGETAPDTATYDYYGWKHPEDWVTSGLGGCVRVSEGAAAPDAIYPVVDCTTDATGYTFIENLMRQAYNYILVPVLNDITAPWLRRTAGVVYEEKYTRRNIYDSATGEWVRNEDYDPDYKGDESNVDPMFASLFNLDVVIPTVDFSTYGPDDTFVNTFNTIAGNFVESLLHDAPVEVESPTETDWSWDYSRGNAALLTNACSVVRYVLQKTGGYFFYDFVADDLLSESQLEALGDAQLLGYLLGSILNCFVPWMYIDLDSVQSLVDIGYEAVAQLAWQDIPQFTYTKPERANYSTDAEYYDALVNKALTILFDVATYNLNQGFDMIPTNGNDPVNGTGLIQYQGDTGSWETTMIQIVTWAISNYGAIFALDFNCDLGTDFTAANYQSAVSRLTIDDVWEDLDTLINAIIPIKGNGAWIAESIASQPIVSKSFVFTNILNSIYTLDASGISEIFEKNPTSEFASLNGVEIIVSFLRRIFNVLAPNVFADDVTTVDGIVNNQLLGTMVYDFLNALGTNGLAAGKTTRRAVPGRADDLIKVALPIVCLALGLSDDQEFGEMEIYLPETVAAGTATPSFRVYNSSSGINTGYTNAAGSFSQDALYKYTVTSVVTNIIRNGATVPNSITAAGIGAGTVINGGEAVNVTLNGTLADGDILELNISYNIAGEDGTNITSTPLTSTVYSYVGANSKSDDELETTLNFNEGQDLVYTKGIYLGTNEKLSAINNYSFRVKAQNAGGTAQVTNVTSDAAWLSAKGEDAIAIDSGDGSIFFINPFEVTEDRLVIKYDDDDNEISRTGTVEDGSFTATSTVVINGTTKNVVTGIHLYNDYGLTSLYRKAIAANRQASNYSDADGGAASGYFASYKTALQNAATLVLSPKTADTFAAKIVATDSESANLYEQYAKDLQNWIDKLAPYEINAGTTAIEQAVNGFSGLNYVRGTNAAGHDTLEWLEYYEAGYVFFGMHDYVPHTYNRYKDARNRATKLIDSQYLVDWYADDFVPSDEKEAEEYNKFMAEYAENKASLSPISAVDAAYAIHMVNLMGERLIPLAACKDKFDIIYALCVTNANIGTTNTGYTTESWEAYQHARAFANTVNAANVDNLKPSQVNIAASELMEAWKRLVMSADYSSLDIAIAAAESVTSVAGKPATQTAYTAESYATFYSAYEAAVNIDRGLASTTANQDRIDSIRIALQTAQDNLEYATAEEAVWEITTEDLQIFWNADYSKSFIPSIETEKIEYYRPTLSDGTTLVDGYIYGVGLNCDADAYSAIFPAESRSNCEVVVSPNENSGMYGTGTIIQIVDNNGDVLATYQVIVFGDVTGDGCYDYGDVGEVDAACSYIYDWEWNSLETYDQYNAVACDLDVDGMITNIDVSIVADASDELGDIDQQTGIYEAY